MKNIAKIEMVQNKPCFKCGYSTNHASLSFQRPHDCRKVIEEKRKKAEKAQAKKSILQEKMNGKFHHISKHCFISLHVGCTLLY